MDPEPEHHVKLRELWIQASRVSWSIMALPCSVNPPQTDSASARFLFTSCSGSTWNNYSSSALSCPIPFVWLTPKLFHLYHQIDQPGLQGSDWERNYKRLLLRAAESWLHQGPMELARAEDIAPPRCSAQHSPVSSLARSITPSPNYLERCSHYLSKGSQIPLWGFTTKEDLKKGAWMGKGGVLHTLVSRLMKLKISLCWSLYHLS